MRRSVLIIVIVIVSGALSGLFVWRMSFSSHNSDGVTLLSEPVNSSAKQPTEGVHTVTGSTTAEAQINSSSSSNQRVMLLTTSSALGAPVNDWATSFWTKWDTLNFDDNHLHVSYPTVGLPGGVPMCNIRNSTVFAIPCITNFFFQRTVSNDDCCEDAVVIISKDEKEPSSTLPLWVETTAPSLSLNHVPTGTIEDALAQAYASKDRGGSLYSVKIITTTERLENGSLDLELGAIVDGGGRLSYLTLLQSPSGDEVYAIELVLEYDAAATSPTDQQYIAMYQRMVATFAGGSS